MPISAKSVIEAVARELEDLASVRWRLTSLIQYLNDGLAHLIILRPDLGLRDEPIQLAEGVKQSVPGVKLLAIKHNSSRIASNPITLIPAGLLDAQEPGWRRLPFDRTIQHYMWDPRSPNKFDVYPPAAFGAYVQAEFVAELPPVSVPTVGDTYSAVAGSIDLNQYLQPALVAYVLHRCYSQRNELSDPTKAAAYMQRYAEIIGVDVQATLAAANAPGKSEPKAQ